MHHFGPLKVIKFCCQQQSQKTLDVVSDKIWKLLDEEEICRLRM